MFKNVTAQIIFRTAYLAVAVTAFFTSIGFWSIGTGAPGSAVNGFFFLDYYNWALVISIIVTVASLIENVSMANRGEQEGFTKKFPLLKFCTLSTMIFCFILGAFFIDRVGYNRLTSKGTYGSIYPGIATAGYWTDLSVLLPRFICPLAYIAMHILFEEGGKSRKAYSELGIVLPTVFYLFDKFFGMIFLSANGGLDAVLAAGRYEIACPFFFYDDAFTYTQWWWALLWPSIFGVVLVSLNKITFVLSRMVRTDGKVVVDTKSKPAEEKLCDCIHYLKLRLAEKKAAKNS